MPSAALNPERLLSARLWYLVGMLFLNTRSSTCPTRGQRDQKASNGLLSIVEQQHLKVQTLDFLE